MKKGRPSKFSDALKDTIIGLYKEGKTDKQVASIIGVSVRVIQNWKGKYPNFLHSIRNAKQIADELIVASLFSRAVGYSHPEEKILNVDGQVERVSTTRHYPPDTKAIIYWLQNRQPTQWRAKHNEIVINNNPMLISDQALDDELAALLKEYEQSRKK